jgi:hypothetical protein
MIRIATVAAGLAAAQVVFADAIPYSTPGHVNTTTYSFTASSDGNLVAYFAGSTAGFHNQLGVLVNGVDTGIYGLDDHASSLGDSLDFGHVNSGDSLVFVLKVFDLGYNWYSNQSLNSDGVNHVYATPYTATSVTGDGIPLGIIPPGTYVAFEDLPGGGDLNYHDENFVFTNVSGAEVPDSGSTICLFGTAILGLGFFRRRRA